MKAFCQECVYRTTGGCRKEYEVKHNYFHSWKVPTNSAIKNKNNDCKDFKSIFEPSWLGKMLGFKAPNFNESKR